MTPDYQIAIVGGGIWGLSTAMQIAGLNAGASTVLIERNHDLAEETTKQSAGQVGQLRGDPLLAKAVGITLDKLVRLESETGHDPGFVRSGSVHLALCDARAEMFRRLAVAAEEQGCATEFIDGETLSALVPGVQCDEVVAALHVPRDGYVDARRCALAFSRLAREGGVTMQCGQAVQSLRRSDNEWELQLPDQTLTAQKVIVAGGPWTRTLVQPLRFGVPAYPIRLQQSRTVEAGVSVHHPVVRLPDASCYMRPEKMGYLCGYFDPEPLPIQLGECSKVVCTADLQSDHALAEKARGEMSRVIPRIAALQVSEFRQGMMTCTPDGKFVIGPIPTHENLWVATGCGGTGIASCVAIGKWLASWVVNGQPGDDLSVYDPSRFGDLARDDKWLCEAARKTSAAYYRLDSASATQRK